MQEVPRVQELIAEEIVVRYGLDAPPVLAGLTLALRPGTLIGVVGPNGSGKSTLVRALARTLRPSAGAVRLGGRDLYAALGAPEAAREIAVVPQETAVAFEFSVREVVEMGRTPRLPRRLLAGLTQEDDRAVEAAMHRAGVGDLADRTVPSLSGGERQRVLLARALAQETPLLLLDEPTAHLDLRHQGEALTLARDLAGREGRALLAVLHDLNLAAAHCDHLVLLRAGRIVAQGAPAEVLTEDRIAEVYGTRVWVRRHPDTDRPYLLPLDSLPADTAGGRTVLVLCGGGTGVGPMETLLLAGFAVTGGGLNAGDVDAEYAEAQGIPFPREAPFSPLSRAVIEAMERAAASADAVVLANVPFGPANLSLLEVALATRRSGKPVFCVQPDRSLFSARDFTGGAATRLWEALLMSGAHTVGRAEEIPARIRAGFE